MLVWNHNSLRTFKKRIGPVSHLLAKHANKKHSTVPRVNQHAKTQGRTTYHAMLYILYKREKSKKPKMWVMFFTSNQIKSRTFAFWKTQHFSPRTNLCQVEWKIHRQMGFWLFLSIHLQILFIRQCWFSDSDHNQTGSEIMNHTNEPFSIFTPLTYTMLDESNTVANRYTINNHSNQSFTSSFGWCLTP